MTDRELALFLRWLLKHYSTATIDGMFGYVDSMDKEVDIEQIIEHYKLKKSKYLDEAHHIKESFTEEQIKSMWDSTVPKISDEEIHKYAYNEWELDYESFEAGAKWYREQIKFKQVEQDEINKLKEKIDDLENQILEMGERD